MARETDAKPLGEVLRACLPGQVAAKLPEPGLLAAWRAVAGDLLAQRARPVCMEPGGVLVVAAPSGPWRQELTLAGPGLCEALRRAGFSISSLKLVAARTPPPPPPPEPPPRRLTAEDESGIERLLATVRDDELRRALERAMRAQLSAGPDPGR